jgi:hypothetical protein
MCLEWNNCAMLAEAPVAVGVRHHPGSLPIEERARVADRNGKRLLRTVAVRPGDELLRHRSAQLHSRLVIHLVVDSRPDA